MTPTELDKLYDPVYKLENLARLGSVEEFDAEFKNANSKGFKFTPQQLQDVEAARILCCRNAVFLLEEPCNEAAQSGNLTALENTIRKLNDCYHASNQSIDQPRLEEWRKTGAGAAISKAVEQAEQFALAKVTTQRDALILKAHEISEQYNVPFTTEQNESERRSLQTTRLNEITTLKTEIIAIVAAAASVSGGSKLEQVGARLSQIQKYSKDAGLTTTPEEETAFNNQWAPQLRTQLLSEALALAETRGISPQLKLEIDSLKILSSPPGLRVSEGEIETIIVKAATKSLSNLVKQAEQPLSISAFDKLEQEITAFIAAAEAQGRTTPISLNSEQVALLSNAFLNSRHTAITKHFLAAEKEIQDGSWSKAELALTQAEQIYQDRRDPRFRVPLDYEHKKSECTAKIGRLKIDQVFEEIFTIVPRGDYLKVDELGSNIRKLAESYAITLSPQDEKTISHHRYLVRQNAVNSIMNMTIDKIDFVALEKGLALIQLVLDSAGEDRAAIKLSPNTTRLMQLLPPKTP